MPVNPDQGNWRKLNNGGQVEVDWCWRCSRKAAQLVTDPMVQDAIGVCRPCAAARERLKRLRRRSA